MFLLRADVRFSANADGVKGAGMVAGGVITGKSSKQMVFCGTRMETSFHASFVKLVQEVALPGSLRRPRHPAPARNA